MTDTEYARWIIKDTWLQLKPALIGYAAVLTVYWAVV